MNEPKPPPWESDGFSQLFQLAQNNERINALNMPALFRHLGRGVDALMLTAEAVTKDDRAHLLIPRWLLVRGISSVLAGTRLGLSGQSLEAHAVLRVGIEQAWYALHIARDPSEDRRARLWMSREVSRTSLKEFKDEFKISAVRATHRSCDLASERNLHRIYARTIDFGGHPNPLGVLSAMNIHKAEKGTGYEVLLVSNEPNAVLLALQTTSGVAIGLLKVFQRIYPERFTIASLDPRIDELVTEANSIFKVRPS
jgi:hypothetical protein